MTFGYVADKDALRKRLRRIEGQVRGLERMVDEEQYCVEVLTQIGAVAAPQAMGRLRFGAQAPPEDIVAETHERARARRQGRRSFVAGGLSVPGSRDAAPTVRANAWTSPIVDEEPELREQLACHLERAYPELCVYQFSHPARRAGGFTIANPALVFTELAFSAGASWQGPDRGVPQAGRRARRPNHRHERARPERGGRGAARARTCTTSRSPSTPVAVGTIAGS